MRFWKSLLAALTVFMMLTGYVLAQPADVDVVPGPPPGPAVLLSPLGLGEYEIAYDDGTMDYGLGRDVCNYWAVLFTVPEPPGYPCDLVMARLTVGKNYEPFEVVVYDSDGVTVLWSQTVPPTGEDDYVWINVPIDPPLNVHGDFFIAMHYTELTKNYLGLDMSDPDGRSYYGPPMTLGTTWDPGDWMIRAVVTEKPPVGGAILPASKAEILSSLILNPTLIASLALTASATSLVAVVFVKRRKRKQ